MPIVKQPFNDKIPYACSCEELRDIYAKRGKPRKFTTYHHVKLITHKVRFGEESPH